MDRRADFESHSSEASGLSLTPVSLFSLQSSEGSGKQLEGADTDPSERVMRTRPWLRGKDIKEMM